MADPLLDALAKVHLKLEADLRIKGTLGSIDPSTGNITFDVPGRPGYVWVQPVYGGQKMAAFNDGAPLLPNAPVVVAYDYVTHIWKIEGINTALSSTYAGANNTPIVSGAPQPVGQGTGHNPLIPSNLFLPGMVTPSLVSPLSISIYQFNYVWGGQKYFFPTTEFDLTPYLPASANTHGWVLVGVDPTNNTATALAGTTYPTATTLTQATVNLVSFTNKLPLFAVAMYNGQTALTNTEGTGGNPGTFADCRPWLAFDNSYVETIGVQAPIINVGTALNPIIGLSTPLAVGYGGIGSASLPAHAMLIGAGGLPITTLAPSTNRNVAISDGTDWKSRALVAADLPTVYNQTIQNGGSALAQEPIFNFIAGTNLSLTIVDNPGSTRTDITINATASGSVTSIATGTGLTGGPITTTGTISLVVPVVASSGGTGQTSLTAHNLIIGNGTSAVVFLAPGTKGNIIASNATDFATVGVGADYAALVADSTQTTGVNYTSATTSALLLPVGTTAQEPTSAVGLVRYNSTTGRYEFGIGSSTWVNHVRLSGDTMTGNLSILTTDAGTTTIIDPLTIAHRSSGTPTTGFGTEIKLQADNASNVLTTLALINASWNNAGATTVNFAITALGINVISATTAQVTIGAGASGLTLLQGDCQIRAGNSYSWSSGTVSIANPTTNVVRMVGGAAPLILRTGSSGWAIEAFDTAITSIAPTVVQHTLSSGTAGNNIGIDLTFKVADSTSAAGTGDKMSRIRNWWTNATNTANTLAMQGALSGYWNSAGTITERDVMQWGVSGTGAALWSIFSVTTPIAQPANTVALGLALSNLGLRAAGAPSLELLSKYNNDTLVGNGLVSTPGVIHLTAQTASIGTTTTGFTPPSNGMYMVSIALYDTTAAGASVATVSATISWTDPNGAQTFTTANLPVSALGNTTNVITFYATTGSAISYATTVTGLILTAQYELDVVVMRLS